METSEKKMTASANLGAKSDNSGKIFKEGIRDGVPIGLGYLAVSFSLGIIAKTAGFTPLQCFFASLLNNASAGEYALFSLVYAGAGYLEIALMTLVANARYLLMSTAISQRFDPKEKMIHRIFIGFDLTDELFGIAINREGYIKPIYSYGAFIPAMLGWSVGTALGCIAGNMMPGRLVSAFSVALYGMFAAIIIPPAKKNKLLVGIIAVCFALSFLANRLSVFAGISSGTKTIVLTVVIALAAAIIFPRKDEENMSNQREIKEAEHAE